MCNFELAPEQFRQRRVEMIVLAEERRLARALKPARARRARAPRRFKVRVPGPAQLRPSPVVRG